MNLPESILRPVKSIFGGAKVPHFKNTAEFETVTLPTPATVCIPMSQHIGAPAKVCVEVGEKVYVGSILGECDSFVCAPVHSSVSGTVTEIAEKSLGGKKTVCVTVESDGEMKPKPHLMPRKIDSAEALIKAAKDCGLVGLGGAGFPTYIKLSPPKDTKIDTLIINAAECEPFITTDYRECMENYNNVVEGVYLIKEALGIEKVVICIEDNKPAAIVKLYNIAIDRRDKDDNVKLMKLPATYPQGAEKVIIYSATGRKLPAGKLPSDIGCIVMNVTSIATLYRFVKTGMPLVSKRITVDGTAVKEPKNILVPIGTSVKDVLDFVGEIDQDANKVIIGGPMMGRAISDINEVIEKRNNALLIMKETKEKRQTNCIKCGRCVAACPMGLYPQKVEAAYNVGKTEEFSELNVNYCMECGCCSFVCPAARPLTEVMRISKQVVRRNAK